MQNLILQQNQNKRFLQGHPWVFASELKGTLKQFSPTSWARLEQENGKFLAWGTFNPQSLIAFRTVSRDESLLSQGFTAEVFLTLLEKARETRRRLGLLSTSHRLIFGEGDGIPGVVIDCFVGEESQVFVIEINTKGMEEAFFPINLTVLQKYVEKSSGKFSWENTSVLVKRHSQFRQHEGLEIFPTEVLKDADKEPLDAFPLKLSYLRTRELTLRAPLVSGQKTGFFLDQRDNVCALLQLLEQAVKTGKKHLKILDLFCYVGQWSVQLAKFFSERPELEVEYHLVDSSEKALEFAVMNLKALGVQNIFPRKMDIIKNLGTLNERFDILVCDPPALIKSRKDYFQGKKAYLKINSQSLGLLEPGGFFVSCTCSHLLSLQDLEEVVKHSEQKMGGKLHFLHTGQQGLDHPFSLNFPEGRYLKSLLLSREP